MAGDNAAKNRCGRRCMFFSLTFAEPLICPLYHAAFASAACP